MLKDNNTSEKRHDACSRGACKSTARYAYIRQRTKHIVTSPAEQYYTNSGLKYLGFECITLKLQSGNIIPEQKISSPWMFGSTEYCLLKGGVRIDLTETECHILDQFVFSDKRVLSKDEIVKSMNKNPAIYKGLEMCVSRLQCKFKKNTMGDRLIRSVRNKGYCLVQKIVTID